MANTEWSDQKKEWHLAKFKSRKYKLFSKFDEGIILSDTMMYSVTPESTALRIAVRAKELYPNVTDVIDFASGAGGNCIQFALAGYKTTAIDISMENIQACQNNCAVYGVYNVEFYAADGLTVDLSEAISGNENSTLLFASPEWGGMSYRDQPIFDVETCNPKASEIIEKCKQTKITRIGLYLPRTSNLEQLAEMGCSRIDYLYDATWCQAIVAWWGPDHNPKVK